MQQRCNNFFPSTCTCSAVNGAINSFLKLSQNKVGQVRNAQHINDVLSVYVVVHAIIGPESENFVRTYRWFPEMVCKEDVLLWFKESESYERIDMMYALLNMCMPFEIRFLGTCVEEIGKHSFQELRGAAITANDCERLAKDFALNKDLYDANIRHRVTVYLSLLQSRSYLCANWIFNNMLKTEWLNRFIASGNSKTDKNMHNEMLLLFTLALNHPAFTFEHKLYFGPVVQQLLEQNELRPKVTLNTHNYPPGLGHMKPMQVNHLITSIDIPQQSHHISLRGIPIAHSGGDAASMPPPPGFQHPPAPQMPPPPPLDFSITPQMSWPRTFPTSPMYAPTTGAAEYPPPQRPISPLSPLVNQQTSPTPSRPPSPRSTMMRPQSPPRGMMRTQGPPPQQFILPESMPPPSGSASLPPPPLAANFSPDLKNAADDITHIDHDKMREAPWIGPPYNITKLVNGAPVHLCQPPSLSKLPYLDHLDQHLQELSLDGESALHCSSDGSSASSSNHSPPDTPSSGTPTALHCPGRGGESKATPNGVEMPPNYVPYPSFQRSVFCTPYQRHHPAAAYYHPQGPPNGEMVYPFPFVPVLFSSMPAAMQPNCFNCGAMGHLGDACKEQCIEDITQRIGYQLDYGAPPAAKTAETPSTPPTISDK